MTPKTDEQLVARYRESGIESDLAELVDRYYRPIYSFVFRYLGNAGDAQDVTQDVFVNMWRHLHLFDSSRKFKTWLFAIAKNASLNSLKKRKDVLLPEDAEGNAPEIADESATVEELYNYTALGKKLDDALAQIGTNQRSVLTLRYEQEMTFQEIANVMEVPVDTVKSWHRRALAALRQRIAP